MARWSIGLIDQFKASNGSSKENLDERQEVEKFKVGMGVWAAGLGKIKDKWMARAWDSNCRGLYTHLGGVDRGDYLFKVYQSTTGVVYLMGKLKLSKWGLDISEVISHTDPMADLEVFVADVANERDTNPLQSPQTIDLMMGRAASTRDDIRQSVPMACMFAWAATNSKKVTLTANTVGLIKLYGGFGFELLDTHPRILHAMETAQKKGQAAQAEKGNMDLHAAYMDAKFTEINALMALGEKGRAGLAERWRPFVDYLGPSLA